jgi:hypothetical protein
LGAHTPPFQAGFDLCPFVRSIRVEKPEPWDNPEKAIYQLTVGKINPILKAKRTQENVEPVIRISCGCKRKEAKEGIGIAITFSFTIR